MDFPQPDGMPQYIYKYIYTYDTNGKLTVVIIQHFEEPVAISEDNSLPKKFKLSQNYPNPFNPITTIHYELSQRSDVQITIYDLLGRTVKTLVNQTQEVGYKTVIWNATNDQGKPVSAGVYLFQIRAGDYVQTRKMVLLK